MTACSPASAPDPTPAPTRAAPETTPVATTAATTTTTVAPLQRVAVTGELPRPVLNALSGFYSWLIDDRNVAPAPPAMLAALQPLETEPDTLAATGVVHRFDSGDSVAVAHVGEDVVLLVADERPWRIAGAMLDGQEPWLGPGPRLLLVLGSDARPGQDQQRLRADSIHIVGVDPTRGAGSIVGFPRDSWVPGPDGKTKFTDLMAGRGPDVMLTAAEEVTGLDIDGYVVTGFVGFEGLIDDLGGLVIDLPRAIKSGIEGWEDYARGLQALDATAVLRLARIRKTLPGGDFARSRNHGLIMVAAMIMIQELGIDQLPTMMEFLLTNAWTDLSTEDLLTWGATVYLLTPEEMDNIVLPGSVGTAAGKSVVFLGRRAPAIYADLADGVLDE